MSNPTIGFIGLGIMGRPMTKNLLKAGFTVIGYDLFPAGIEDVVAAGAQAGTSIADVTKRSDVIITMLPDTPDVEKVALGPDGVMANIKPGSLYIDMSTVSPTVAEQIGKLAGEKGVEALDAPVSGGDVGAQKGTLSIMVGGTEAAFERALPVFAPMGKATLCGKHGAGQVVKACNQILVGVTIAGVAEALTLGAKAGVDPAKIVQVLGGGLARCGILENRGQRIVSRDFNPGFRCRLHYKDMRIIMAAGQAYGVPLMVSSIVHDLFKRMIVAGRGEYDHTGLITAVEEMAGIEVKKHEE